MSALAELEVAVRTHRAFDRIDTAYLHRAVREDGFGLVRGRDAICAAAIAALADEGHGAVEIVHDVGDMVVFRAAGGWRGHRWVWREGERILRETLIVDGAVRARSLGRDVDAEALRLGRTNRSHAPLGELDAGRGQCAATAAVLPHAFPAAARPFAEALHDAWNRRALGGVAAHDWQGPDGRHGNAAEHADWLVHMLALLPDAVLLFERGLVASDRVALLWHLHGHTSGVRVRVPGSTVFVLDRGVVVGEETMLDSLAIAAQLHRPMIEYGA